MNDFFELITEKNEEEIAIPQKSHYDPSKKQKLVIFVSNQKKKSYLGFKMKSYLGEILSWFQNEKLDLQMKGPMK